MAMDQHKLRTLVFEKTGVRIDLDDPIFALVALNEAVLEDAVERHIAAIDNATGELVRRARDVGGLAPERAVEHDVSNALQPAANATSATSATSPTSPHTGTQAAGAAFAAPRLPHHRATRFTGHEWRLLAAAGGVAILSALLVLAGQAAFTQPGLTAAQTRSLQQAERLTTAINKLDPKLRAEVQARLPK